MRTPVTVGELVDALTTYPRDALVLCEESGSGTGTIDVWIDDKLLRVWDGTSSAGNWYKPETIPFENLRPRKMEAA